MKRIIFTICAAACIISAQAQKKYTVTSPDNKTQVTVTIDKKITYNITVDNKLIVGDSEIGFKTSAEKNTEWKVSKTSKTSVNEILQPVVWQKSNTVENRYNRLSIDFRNGTFVGMAYFR